MDAYAIGVVALSLIGLLDGLMICMNAFPVFSTSHFAPTRLRCGSCAHGSNSTVLCFGMLVMNTCTETTEFGGIEVV